MHKVVDVVYIGNVAISHESQWICINN